MDSYQYQFGRGIKFASVTVLVTIIMALWYFTKNTDCNIDIGIIDKLDSHSYQLKSMGACKCLQTIDNGITSKIVKSTTCSKASAMKGKFHRKVISYSYYETSVPDPRHRNYFNGIQKSLHGIKNNFGGGWSMRLYVQLWKTSSIQRKELCHLACTYPEEFELCDIENNPKYGNVSQIFPMNWRFLSTLDSQVDIAFSRDLDMPFTHREFEAINEFLNSSKEFHFMRDHPQHNVPILGGLWGVKLTPNIRHRIHQSFEKIFKSSMFYNGQNHKGSDQDLLEKFIWPWAKDFSMGHDSYFCQNYINSRPFPTKREQNLCNFIGCISEEDYFNLTEANECPIKCRPKEHPNWKHC